ncbi:MAG: M1 family metallopeptidase [Nitrososphaerales archaeon]
MDIKDYTLSLDVDYYSLAFKGREKIRVANPDKILVLDSFGLDIRKVELGEKEISFDVDASSKKMKINGLPDQESDIEINIIYEGKVTEKTLYGIYKSRYGSDYFVTTDFEPNGARLLFPCVDNPSFKAEFELEVITQKGLKVVSNANLRSVLDLDDGKRLKYSFEKTPRMSTYLFYLGIGKFDQASLRDDGVDFRISTKPGYGVKGKYALDNAVKFLRSYEEYFSIPYPLSKLDLIALPEYASGAMENWGAITFREVLLLIDENSSVSNRRSVTSVLGHEIAHMWFGDLVTMRWWNDLWLNESFATFMENKTTQKLYPEWNVLSDFVQQTTAGALQSDSLSSTHPIDVEVKAPEEISQIFDEISYGKGASVLRMMEAWIGQDSFRRGVSKYLSQFRYSNAEGKDLWRHLEEASGKPVSKLMEAWVKKPGFPLVRVSLDQQAKKLVFSQERFLLLKDGSNTKNESKFSDPWPIPISCRINGTEQEFLLKDASYESSLGGEEILEFKVNLEQTGFYRVLYDQKLYSTIKLEFESLGPFDKWGITSDLFAFLIAGKVDPDQYFAFAEDSADETEYLICDALTTQLQFLRFISPENPKVKLAYLNHHRAHMNRLGLDSKDGEKDTDKILRGRIAMGLALEDTNFAEELAKQFLIYEKVDPNLRTALAVAVAQTKGEQGFQDLVNKMKQLVGSEADVIKIYYGLASFRDPKLVEKTLDLCISGEISRADSLYAVIDAAQNPYVRGTTWAWFKANFHVFRELFQGTPYVSQIMQEVISRAGIGRKDEVKNYLSNTKINEAERGIRKGVELLEIYSDLENRLEGQLSR